MGYKLEFNIVLSITSSTLKVSELEAGKQYTTIKDGERLFPLNIPIDLCDSEYNFYAKVAVRKLILCEGKTELNFDVLKLFTDAESKVITENFAKSA